MSITLDTPFKTGKSIRSVNYFNNRLLSAEDLNTEKDANRSEHKQLGCAIGDGIVYGLEVSVADATVPSLLISPGLAVNRWGRAFELPEQAVVTFSEPPGGSGQTAPAVEFAECEPPQGGVYILKGGVYLLTIRPTETGEGRALVSGLNGAAAGCNTKYRVSAVKFRRIPLDDLLKQELSDLQTALNQTTSAGLAAERLRQNHLLRNRMAHACFGSSDARLDAFIADPFGPRAADYGLLANLRQLSDTNANKLTNCEVPLAVVYWTNTDLPWVDMWSVRRRITVSDPGGLVWPLRADRRISEGEAIFMQFQAQLADLRDTLNPPAIARVVDYFRYLPPVGMVPLANARFDRGFHPDLFFDQVVHHPLIHIEGGRVGALVSTGLRYGPLEVSTHISSWIYSVRENERAVAAQPYFIFTTGHMPYMGDPHFDVNRWDFSNWNQFNEVRS